MTIRNAFQLLFIGLLTLGMGIPGILFALLLPGTDRKGRFFRVLSKSYARAAFALLGVTVEIRGRENVDPSKPYVFMANHISLADSPAIAIAVPQTLHWVFKKELSRIPVFGWVLLACGQIMVDRHDPERSRDALGAAAGSLSGNRSVLIYPEGTRSRDGSLLPLRKGGFHMALRAALPIVPVRVSGTKEIVAADTLRIRGGTAVVEFFPPIPTEGVGEEGIPALRERVAEALRGGTRGPGEETAATPPR